MQTFDQHLLEHLQAGRITMEEAMHVATSPHDFKLMVAAESRTPGKLGSPSRAALAAPDADAPAAPNPVGAGTASFAPTGPPAHRPAARPRPARRPLRLESAFAPPPAPVGPPSSRARRPGL